MKKLLALSLLSAAFFAVAAENPIYNMYSDEITFSASFTDTLEADMANGKGEPRRIMMKDTPVTYKPGMFGKALASNSIMYDAAGNVDMRSPGTAVCWASPTWDSTPQKKEPGFTIFSIMGSSKDQVYDLICGKMSNQPWNKGHLNAYVQYNYGKKGVTSCIIWDRGMVSQWPAGEWHLFVVTWGNGTISYSVDGKKSSVSELKEVLAAPTDWFTVRANTKFIVDEFTILNKRLTDEEIAKLYEAGLKAAGKK